MNSYQLCCLSLVNSFNDFKSSNFPEYEWLNFELNDSPAGDLSTIRIFCNDCQADSSIKIGHFTQFTSQENECFRTAAQHFVANWEQTDYHSLYKVCFDHAQNENYYVIVTDPESFEEVLEMEYIEDLTGGRITLMCECHLENVEQTHGFVASMIDSVEDFCECDSDNSDNSDNEMEIL